MTSAAENAFAFVDVVGMPRPSSAHRTDPSGLRVNVDRCGIAASASSMALSTTS